MRISDPLSDIRSAYLWFQATCDTTPEPDPRISSNYILMNFTRRLYSSACEDEDSRCYELSHLCSEESVKRQCARTCQQCRTENQMGLSPFEEQYRGSWMESSRGEDILYNISSYTLSRGQEVTYDCLRMDEDIMKDKRVLLELSNNGCLPRYACVEMSKVTSSVMRFRLGNRVVWPLPSNHNKKAQICNTKHFKSTEGRSMRREERPHRLLVNIGRVQEVACEIPHQLQNGIAFNEEDTEDRVCEGCLNFTPDYSRSRFIIQPTNCSADTDGSRRRSLPLEYSCLASFNFRNRSRGVVTKTSLGTNSGVGQYLTWVFTKKDKIQVMKAAESFILEHRRVAPHRLLEVEFSVQEERNGECRAIMLLPRTTSTPRPPPIKIDDDFWDDDYSKSGHYGGSEGSVGSKVSQDRKAIVVSVRFGAANFTGSYSYDCEISCCQFHRKL
ncbi:hypothetical protein ElyMa_005813000 [Elysia marginata]|uniref:ShKT domain-containing protein n=1 Tax=Elysia marginata TaxID=1093978 RepID=A0AAV4FUD5_9GAST|nr:hypothetical protein ElyMa_005813000 [Elysia marginata]